MSKSGGKPELGPIAATAARGPADPLLACPSCREPMTRREVAGHYGRSGEIDYCATCRGFWFDGQELLALTPGATLELVALLGGEPGAAPEAAAPRQPLGGHRSCPRCGKALRLSHDRQRATRFAYHRCPEGHGRFLTYFQFLQAKGLVRELAGRELAELVAAVRQIRCSNCGAPVDLAAGAVCSYCQTPAAVLDPTAMEEALAELRAAEEARRNKVPDPTLPLQLAIERLRIDRTFSDIRRDGGWLASGDGDWLPFGGSFTGDLVFSALGAIHRWLTGRRG